MMRLTTNNSIIRQAAASCKLCVMWAAMGIVANAVMAQPSTLDTLIHARQNQTEVKEPARVKPVGPTELSGCSASDCHPGKKEYSYLHGPLFVDACNACHVSVNPKLHQYELARATDQLCVYCHEFDLADKLQIHEPFGDGTCLPCHSPHGGSGPNFLKSESYGDLCLSCHDDHGGARNLSHGPASAGACNACHEPHASNERKLLELDGRELCLQCHVSLDIEIETARVVHEPVTADCQVCHNPHETENKSLLIMETTELCIRCHEDIHQTIEESTTAHGAMLTERSCVNCHSPHASDYSRLLKNDIETLCFECHNQEIELEDGTKLVNIKEIIETGASLHGPVASGNCTACHEIHGGNNRKLLVREYSDKLYSPFDETQYALCFGCHDRALVMDERTTTVTQFRNGDVNLHNVHVNNDQKGRTCSVCHDSHAANRELHIHDTVPFGPGGWNLPIYFQKLENGGSCASGCHQGLEYNRVNPVNINLIHQKTKGQKEKEQEK